MIWRRVITDCREISMISRKQIGTWRISRIFRTSHFIGLSFQRRALPKRGSPALPRLAGLPPDSEPASAWLAYPFRPSKAAERAMAGCPRFPATRGFWGRGRPRPLFRALRRRLHSGRGRPRPQKPLRTLLLRGAFPIFSPWLSVRSENTNRLQREMALQAVPDWPWTGRKPHPTAYCTTTWASTHSPGRYGGSQPTLRR